MNNEIFIFLKYCIFNYTLYLQSYCYAKRTLNRYHNFNRRTQLFCSWAIIKGETNANKMIKSQSHGLLCSQLISDVYPNR